MTSVALKRASRELVKFQNRPPGVFSVKLAGEGDLLHWHVVLEGPVGSPYAGGLFKVAVELSEDYPNKAPTIRFISHIFHPTIDKDGRVCEGIFNDWAPSCGVADALQTVLARLSDPGTDAVLNEEAGRLYSTDRTAFNVKARQVMSENPE